jgi:hypothetical protein
MICTKVDSYMGRLIENELVISWLVTLTDGTSVYGDYERPDFDNPWIRLGDHCQQNNVAPAKVELYMFGAPKKVFFENPEGLDGLAVYRGIAKDQAMQGGHAQSFQILTVCLLRDDCSCLDVAKYTWPYNQFEKSQSVRGLTHENLKDAIFKNDSPKRQHPEVQKYLDGDSV